MNMYTFVLVFFFLEFSVALLVAFYIIVFVYKSAVHEECCLDCVPIIFEDSQYLLLIGFVLVMTQGIVLTNPGTFSEYFWRECFYMCSDRYLLTRRSVWRSR